MAVTRICRFSMKMRESTWLLHVSALVCVCVCVCVCVERSVDFHHMGKLHLHNVLFPWHIVSCEFQP